MTSPALFTGHPDLGSTVLEGGLYHATEAMEVSQEKPRAMVEWQGDPVGWAEEILEIPANTLRWSLSGEYADHEWDGTEDPIAALLEEVAAGRDVGVESGTGTGKSFGCAVLTLWFLACFEDSRVNSYAPKEDQLRKFMWAEITELWPKFQRHFPGARLSDLRIRMWKGDKWSAQGVATQVRAGETSATKAQGTHAKYQLLIVEEGPGVQKAIYNALYNTQSYVTEAGQEGMNVMVAVGNPDGLSDPLHEHCELPFVTHVVASALDHPNVVTGRDVIPGAVTTAGIERRRELYADRPELFASRVRGICPEYKTGLALRFRRNRHLLTFDEALLRKALDEEWQWYAGMDFGAWRFSCLVGCVDRVGRLWIVREFWSGFGDSLSERARALHELFDALRLDIPWRLMVKRLTFVGDAANATDILEINRAWRVMRSPLKVSATAMATKARSAAVERLNDLFATNRIAFARDLGADLEWKKGATTSYQGDTMTGSRVLWELGEWAYPEPTTEGKAQREDPDDDTADGADGIAALRYLSMTWLKAAGFEVPEALPNPNIDTGLEELAEHHKARFREAMRRSA